MVMNQKIQLYIEKLPLSYLEELENFLAYLLAKAERQEELEWSRFSLASAMRGMEDEPSEYTLDDLKVRYQ